MASNSHPLVVAKVERKGLLDIDLNVAPPEDGDFESPEAENGGSGEEIRPAAVARLASDEDCLDLNGDFDNRNGVRAHWSEEGNNGLCGAEDEEEQVDTANSVADSEAEMDGKDCKNSGWNTLLEVAATALRELEENSENRKRRPSQGVELGGEPHRVTTRTKINEQRRQSTAAEWNGDTDVSAAALAAPVVMRSTRGRALAMPSKYRDSVLDAVAEAGLPRHSKSCKSATVVPTKRKSR